MEIQFLVFDIREICSSKKKSSHICAEEETKKWVLWHHSLF